MNAKPNFFVIAPQELAQDGYIAWLAAWADPGNSQYDPVLHGCAQDFARMLIQKQYQENVAIRSVQVYRQWKNTDITIDVNGEYFIVIEDKTNTNQHSNQLLRYKKIAMEHCEHCAALNAKPVLIYIKTVTPSKSERKEVEDAGYAVIERGDLIPFFGKYAVKNAIYMDFYDKLIGMEKAEQAYLATAIKDWDAACWRGFFHYLESKLEKINGWGPVSHIGGAFWGLWWHTIPWLRHNVYLQIEERRLCFKIYADDPDPLKRKETWDALLRQLMSRAAQEGLKILWRSRFKDGYPMTVAYIRQQDWLGEDDAIIDADTVAQALKRYHDFLERAL